MLRDFFKNEETMLIDEQIRALLLEMKQVPVTSEEYLALIKIVEQLKEVKAKASRNPVSWDTVAIVAGNILVTLVIVAYEQKHVWASKAPTQVIRQKPPGT